MKTPFVPGLVVFLKAGGVERAEPPGDVLDERRRARRSAGPGRAGSMLIGET